ncbi:MAG: hypothetical protein Kow0037_06300 [Calditrichia bacterium]
MDSDTYSDASKYINLDPAVDGTTAGPDAVTGKSFTRAKRIPFTAFAGGPITV